MYSNNDIERVRLASPIEDVIAKRIPIKKKSGGSYVALCPFHNDSTPSMNIHRGKQIFKCFSCGEGGDVFKFVMKYDGLGFTEAVELLANEYHVNIEKVGGGQRQDSKVSNELNGDIKRANEFAMNIYHQFLMLHKDAKTARQYLLSRKISPNMCKKYHIGYAHSSFDFLFHLMKSKFSPEVLNASGLFFNGKSGQPMDFMRERVLFPILNERNEVLGFGGRILEKKADAPKYLNTRETPIFLKQQILYGLNHSMGIIKNTKKAYVVEGYLDVIACLEVGIGAVAPLGTSLTEGHLRRLKRLADQVCFVFDGDEAGQKAALRACLLSLSVGIDSSVAILKGSEDPFDIITQKGGEAFTNEVQTTEKDTLEHLFSHYTSGWQQANEYGRTKILEELRHVIAQISDETLRERVMERFASQLNVRGDVFINKTQRRPVSQNLSPTTPLKEGPTNSMQRRFVIFLICYPQFIKDSFSLFSLEDFQDETANLIYKKLLNASINGTFNFHDFIQHFNEPIRDYIEKRVLLTEESMVGTDKKEVAFQRLASRLKELSIKEQIKEIKTRIASMDEEQSKPFREELLRLFNERNNLNRYFTGKG